MLEDVDFGPKSAIQADINKIISKLKITKSNNLEYVYANDIKVAATQVLFKRYASLTDYVIDMNMYISNAAKSRAQMICFPAYAALLPLTFNPQYPSVLHALKRQQNGLPTPNDVLDAIEFFSEKILDVHFCTMSALAAKHNIYIMSGSAFCVDDGRVRHRAFLFDNEGNLVGFQDKISMNKLETSIGMSPASEVRAFSTKIGDVSILTCEDADHFEIAKVATKIGSKILLCPTISMQKHTAIGMAMGINMRVQENYTYGVKSVLVGHTGFGVDLFGRAGILVPNTLMTRKNGVLVQTSGEAEPDFVVGKLDYNRTTEKTSQINRDRNRKFMEEHIDYLF